MEIETFSAGETHRFGKKMGEAACPGQVYCLDGDLGAGKTVFTQGFAEGLGIRENVNSPTFTILQIYESGRMPLYHFDVYRIGDSSEMDEIGWDEYVCKEGVSLVEWACRIEDILPQDAVRIRIEKDFAKGADYRRITADGWNRTAGTGEAQGREQI